MEDVQEQTGYTTEDTAKPTDSRRSLVEDLCSEVEKARAKWSDRFKQMRADQKFAIGYQWPNDPERYNYVANITLRHVQQRTAALYAKNPKAVARRRDRIDYVEWDGDPDSIAKAQEHLQVAMQAMMPPDPNAVAVVQDYMRVMAERNRLDRVGKTLEVLYAYFWGEQKVPMKKQMKRLVRRVITTGVGFVKVDFQRAMKPRPDVERQLEDTTNRMAMLERMARDMSGRLFDEASAEWDRLNNMLQQLQNEDQVLVREGLVFNFPRSSAIIPDYKCTCLDGFQGADFVATEYIMSVDRIKEVYDVDVSNSFSRYDQVGKGHPTVDEADFRKGSVQEAGEASGEDLACVWEIEHKRDGLVYVVCDGYPDFLKPPQAPNVQVERFWTTYALMFNEVDSDSPDDIYPPSDVALIRDAQMEYNRARQGLREHRVANRPKTITGTPLSDEDKEKLETHPANAVIELDSLQPNQKVGDLLQPWNGPPIDPNLYEVNINFEDVLRTVGTQEANLGGTSNATATESSIAESSRLSSLESNVDDLDEFLSELARGGSQVLLKELQEETVRRIAGQGSVCFRPGFALDHLAQ